MSGRCYLDTSALLPLYRNEAITTLSEEVLEQYTVTISALTEVEVQSALARWVRTGELTEQQAREIETVFAEDLRCETFQTTPITERHYWQAKQWLHQRNSALRTLDALHLAVCEEENLPLITADRLFAKAATELEIPSHHLQT